MRATLTDLEPRNVVKPNKQTGVLTNGIDNAYPTRMERLILASSTAKAAAEMFANFMVGQGFEDESLNTLVVGQKNYKDVTAYDLLEHAARSIAYQYGFFLHTNYAYIGDSKFVKEEILPISFKDCRLGTPDDSDYSAKIVVYDNWDRSRGKLNKKKFDVIDVYNPRPEVITAQVNTAKGWASYKGQVFWEFFNKEYDYPLSPVDVAQDDADTEHQISLFKNGELNGNLFAKYMIRHAYFEKTQDKLDFIEKIKSFQGGKNNGSIMLVEDDISQDETGEVVDNGLKIEKFEQNIDDKLFVNWEKSTSNNIRKAYRAIPTVLIEYVEGKLGGTSGEALVQAANFYNKMTEKDRKKIEQSFAKIFENWKDPLSGNFKIKELDFGSSSTNNV